MKRIVVEVLEDATRPEGGYAVMLLRGVEGLPDRVTFRLKPLEIRGSGDFAGEAWPAGDLKPLAVRRNEAGIELQVGPDIVDCPALIPGTVGVIEIKSAGLRGEFLWPSIRPTARPRRRKLTVVKPPNVRAPLKAIEAVSVPSAAKAPAFAAVAAQSGDRSIARQATTGEAIVPVTALDHATPASATVAEAIGGNVVSFNVAREVLAGSVANSIDRDEQYKSSPRVPGDLPGANPLPSPDKVRTTRGAVEALIERKPRRWSSPSARTTGIIAAAAVFVSGGFLAVGQRAPASVEAPAVKELAAPPAPVAEPAAERAGAGPQTTQQSVVASVAETPSQPSVPVPVPVAEPETERASQPPPRPPEIVTLRMRGGGFQISGELKGFDGSKYVIETATAGLLTMDAARFECDGEACARPPTVIIPLSERPSPAKPDQLRIEGAAALTGAFLPQLIRDYASSIGASVRELPRETSAGQRFRLFDTRGGELATIELVASGSAIGLNALERGTAALAVTDRPQLVEAETRTPTPARTRGAGTSQPAVQPSEIVVGIDGIAVVAAAASAPAAISIDNLAKVMAGQITDWFELGRPAGPIALYLPPDGSGTLETFVRQVMRPRGLELSRSARRMTSDAEAAEAASRDPRGLALAAFADQRSARPINLEAACGLVARPTPFAVKAGEYPLVRRLSLHLPAQMPLPSARGLVRIAQSGEVQNAVAAARLIDPAIAMLPIEEQAERMAWAANAPAASFDAGELRQMLGDLSGATRLSVTFRFVPGTNELDQRSRRELSRLAAALKEPEFTGRRILLAGFTDPAGKLSVNMAAALKRSSQVRTALITSAGTGFDPRLVTAKGYGPLAPVACAGTPEGTRLNRRVEVWVGAKDARAMVR